MNSNLNSSAFWEKHFLNQNKKATDTDLYPVEQKGAGITPELVKVVTPAPASHDLGVAALTGAFFLEIEHEEFSIHALDLFFDLRPRVERAYDRTETSCRADRRKTGNTGSDDEDFSGRDFACGRYLAGEKAAEMLRRLDDRAIAGNVGHRAQAVHLLGARNSRNTVYCQCRHARPGRSPTIFRVL